MGKGEKIFTYDEAMEIGIKAAVKYIREQEITGSQSRYDRRLRNTQLLLRNYRSFWAHCSFANDAKGRIEEENAIDILDSIDYIDQDEIYVNAIKKTRARTQIIIDHIESCIEYYKSCRGKDDSEPYKFDIIYALYIRPLQDDDMPPKYKDVANELNVSVKTVSRKVRKAIEQLSVLFFGVDGIKL